MKNCIFFLAILISFSVTTLAQQKVEGIVFLDKNQNNKLDFNEKGIPNVCVSNGRDVVTTNSDGKWELPVAGGDGVFVIKPANYMVPVNKNEIPQHFVLFGKTAEGAKVAFKQPVNFPLQKTKDQQKFKALFFGDTQARGLREINFVSHDAVEECIGTDAAFGVSLGDIVADGPGLFQEISESVAQINIPWYNVFGNHDHDGEAKNNDEQDDPFARFFGPTTFAFEYGQVVFIGFNDLYFDETGTYFPRFTDDQLLFVKNYLNQVPKDKLVVLMMHAPIVECDNKEDMFALIEDRNYTFSISGHVHEQINYFLGKEEGWNGNKPHHHLVNATVCGSWWCGIRDELGIPHATMNDGAPNGYSIVAFDGNQYRVRFKAARRPADYQMNIYLPDEVKTTDLDTTKILVNVFAGSEKSVVDMQLSGSDDWIPLEHTLTIDPECLRANQLSPYLQQSVDGQKLEDIFGYPMDYPSISTHMWQGMLPTDLAKGTHTVTIRTTDMFAQTWYAHRVVRVR